VAVETSTVACSFCGKLEGSGHCYRLNISLALEPLISLIKNHRPASPSLDSLIIFLTVIQGIQSF
jgi:hypothetical protein